jgi:hypothetical protein
MNNLKKKLFLAGAPIIAGSHSYVSGWWGSNAATIPDAVVEAGKAVNAAVRKGITISVKTPDVEKALTALNNLDIKPLRATVEVDHKIPTLPRVEGAVQLSLEPVTVTHVPVTKKALKTITLSCASLSSFVLFLKLLHDMALNPAQRSLFYHCAMDGTLITAALLLYAAYEE